MFILQILRLVLEPCQISIIELFGVFFYDVRLLENAFENKENENRYFHSWSVPPMPNSFPGFYHDRPGETNYSFTAGSVF